mmetsp:Transcript_1600/g.2117  ORF Transcript_1600/g.2117 Transcript_1600/m.2117 type:complete len:340 (-) Transcript_1600:181-1200(-)
MVQMMLGRFQRCQRLMIRSLSSGSSEEKGRKDERSSTEENRTKNDIEMLESMVERMKTAKAMGNYTEEKLEHTWWQLRERQRRRPGFIGWGVSGFGFALARWSGIIDDGKFNQGARLAIERLHEAMNNEEDEEAFEEFCDRPLAFELRKAILDRERSGLIVRHGLKVLKEPRIGSWRICVGCERREATWYNDDEKNELIPKDDWYALDLLARAGIVLVLPRSEFLPIKEAFREEKGTFALYSAIMTAMNHALDNRSLSLQAVVDFPQVREALLAYHQQDDNLFWGGSTDGFVYTSRQIILETPTFRFGQAVEEPLWTLVDVDNLMNGGARFWRHNYTPL